MKTFRDIFARKEANAAEAEIISMLNEGHEQGLIEENEVELIHNIFAFNDKEAHDIMTNRSNIVAISCDMSLKDSISFMLEEQFSRFPVYEENLDKILGILFLKDAIKLQHKGVVNEDLPLKDLPEVLREAIFIPETRKIDDLFRAMQKSRQQLMIVVDEYGQTVGLISMEDILEELVGNIFDEYDEEEDYIEETSEDQYEIDGLTPLEELEERFSITFDEEDFETLNGYLTAKLGHIPSEEDVFEVSVGNYKFKILSVENKIIRRVLVTKEN